ncbi:MAG: prohibitin family protein [Ignavibacteria bacterium]|jgi:regulator of protease activity HflC (stomatin/prohibitin superfamily)|nr:prohibitin family protein [Ignavibacteria bacterium]
MISLFVIFILIAVVLTVIRKQNSNNQQALKSTGIARTLVLVAAVLVLIFASVVQIGPGEVGVPILFGNVQDNVLKSGLNFVNPLVDIEKLDVKIQAYTMSGVKDEGAIERDDAIISLSSDGLSLKLDVTVWFKLSESEAPNLLRFIGTDYIEKIVRPATRTAIRDITVMFSATDIYSNKRNDFISEITKNLEASFSGKGIILDKVLLRNVELPEKIREAIDEKIAAEQRAQQMVYVLQKEKQEAERKKVEASGIAEAQKIISNTINPMYLQWKYIETLKDLMTSKNNTIVITPYDQKLTPLLNLNQK